MFHKLASLTPTCESLHTDSSSDEVSRLPVPSVLKEHGEGLRKSLCGSTGQLDEDMVIKVTPREHATSQRPLDVQRLARLLDVVDQQCLVKVSDLRFELHENRFRTVGGSRGVQMCLQSALGDSDTRLIAARSFGNS